MNRQCPGGTRPYMIQPGDTYYSLAVRYNLTIQSIINANPGVNPDQLFIGQLICLPEATTTCPGGNSYRIKAGDTYYRISRMFNITVDALIQANPGVDPDQLRIGQIICIPTGGTSGTCPAGTRPYIIQRGDTFYALARRYNTTVAAIQRANPGVNPEGLVIGQRICLPM